MERTRPNRPRHRWVSRGLLLGLGVAALLSVFPSMSLRERVERGVGLLEQARAALLHGDAEAAAAAFERARSEFAAASGQSGNALLRLEALVPLLGRTPDTLLSLAEIGEAVSDAGLEVSRALGDLPLGLASLGLSDGRIPLGAVRSLAPAVHRARLALDAADGVARRLAGSWLPEAVADARDQVRVQLAKAVHLARTTDALLQALPSLSGEGGPRRYLVATQTSAEPDEMEDLTGSYGILSIDHGRLTLGPFQEGSSEPIGFIEDGSSTVGGQHVEGLILVGLDGLADLLEATGPVRVTALGHTFTRANVVRYVTAGSYRGSHLAHPSTDGPRLVAEAIWRRFLATTQPRAALRALVRAGAEGHLIIHAADPSEEAALRLVGVASELGL